MTTRSMITALAALLALTGCDRIAKGISLSEMTARDTTTERVIDLSAGRPPEIAVEIPTLGTGAVLRRVGQNGTVSSWRAPDGAGLSYDGGLLTATRGLGDDLMSAELAGSRAMLAGDAPERGYARIHGYVNGENRTYFVTYLCRAAGRSSDSVTIGDVTRAATRVDEHCTAPDMEFVNSFWVTGDGTVLRSRQWVSDRVGHLETTGAHR